MNYDYSKWAIRIGVVAVFLWFGIDKFFHPVYWLNAWVPSSVLTLAGKFGINDIQFIYLIGVFEVVVGLSLITGIFSRVFSYLAVVFLIFVLSFIGFNEVTVRDLAIIGGLLAVALWPERRI